MQVWVVDAFADARHRGNPAGVIPQPAGFPPARQMQAVAAQLALPTTAFVVAESAAVYHIRWFTPKQELNICGHATVASAWYLHEVAGVDATVRLTFVTGNGPLYTVRRGDRIAVDLPRVDVTTWNPPAGLADAVGARIVHCARAVDDVVLEVESEQVVADLAPDFGRLAKIDCRGHVVTARSAQPGTDFVSRSFFPALGVDEDQVCVSAHCKLAPYWGRRLGKQRMSATQLSRRGGRLHVELVDDRVHVAGTARVRVSREAA